MKNINEKKGRERMRRIMRDNDEDSFKDILFDTLEDDYEYNYIYFFAKGKEPGYLRVQTANIDSRIIKLMNDEKYIIQVDKENSFTYLILEESDENFVKKEAKSKFSVEGVYSSYNKIIEILDLLSNYTYFSSKGNEAEYFRVKSSDIDSDIVKLMNDEKYIIQVDKENGFTYLILEESDENFVKKEINYDCDCDDDDDDDYYYNGYTKEQIDKLSIKDRLSYELGSYRYTYFLPQGKEPGYFKVRTSGISEDVVKVMDDVGYTIQVDKKNRTTYLILAESDENFVKKEPNCSWDSLEVYTF